MLTKVTNIWSIHLKITNIHSDLDLQLGLWLVLVLTLGLVLVYGRGFFTLSGVGERPITAIRKRKTYGLFMATN